MFSLVDLGTLGGDVNPYGLNDHDDVVGSSFVLNQAGQRNAHAFLYLHGCACMQDLGLDYAETSTAWAITDQLIIGMEASNSSAILWNNGGRTELPNADSDEQMGDASAINASGIVVGAAEMDYATQAALWTPSPQGYTVTIIGTLGGTFGGASAVNDAGDTVGAADTTEMGNPCFGGSMGIARQHAFLYKNGVLKDLGAISTVLDQSYARDINDSDEIVGTSTVGDCTASTGHAFLWKDGVMQDLGALGSQSNQSTGESINDSGEIVGLSQVDAAPGISPGTEHAYLYTDGKMHDLNSLIDPTDPLQPDVVLQEATAINCAGDIAAWGYDSRDSTHHHGYLLLREGPRRSSCPQ